MNRTPQSSDQQDAGWYGRFGACLVSPDTHDFENKWATYHTLIQQKVKLNISHYNEMPVSPEIRQFLTSLSLIAPLLYAWEAIQKSSWAVNMFSDKNFVELTSSSAFFYALKDPLFVTKNQDPNFKKDYFNENDGTFKRNFDIILANIRDTDKDNDVKAAFTYFHVNHLIFVDHAGLASALKIARFFNLIAKSSDTTYDEIKGTIGGANDNLSYDDAFMYKLGLPPRAASASDNFTSAYWNLLEASITKFLESFNTGNAQLDNLVSPDTTIPYDDFVVQSHANDDQTPITRTVLDKEYTVTPSDIIAIDGVARTLWGEAAMCDSRGARGFSAVGLVMANRTIAVENSLEKNTDSREQYKTVMQQDVDIFMDSNANDSLKAFVPEKTLGQADFGRVGSLQHAASQVVSRPAQFSCWNGYFKHKEYLSRIAPLPKGMPDFEYTFKDPEPENDQHDLVNVLCPTISSNVHKNDGMIGWDTNFPSSFDTSWRSAVDLATLIVLDANRYKALYNFTPAPESAPLFYTNGGIIIPGVLLMPTNGMTYKNPDTGKTEDFSGGTACNTLKVFSARSRTVYGVSP
jgi:hypothetical protein